MLYWCFSDPSFKMRNVLGGLDRQGKPQPDQSLKAMEQMVDQLGRDLGNRDLMPLFPELLRFCSQLPSSEVQSDVWLHSNDEFEYPEMKKAFRLAFDCSRDLPKQRQAKSEANRSRTRPIETKSYYKEVLDFIDDDSTLLQAKYRVAVALLQCKELSSEGVASCCLVVSQALRRRELAQ